MPEYKYIFGPLPSRRLGLSLGVSPIPKKFCNYSCVYCQLGPTYTMKRKREMYFPVEDILDELKSYLESQLPFDVISIVGEGEPTLYLGLGELILGIKKLTDKPIAVITNGGFLTDGDVQNALLKADIVMPSLDAYDEATFKKINRPLGTINFQEMYQSLVNFSKDYEGELWLEIMLLKGINDSELAFERFKELLEPINYSRLFLNSPIRGTAVDWAEQSEEANLRRGEEMLGGLSIATPLEPEFYSREEDDYGAILSIIRRHPMNQHEIKSFLAERDNVDPREIFEQLEKNKQVEITERKGIRTYRVI